MEIINKDLVVTNINRLMECAKYDNKICDTLYSIGIDIDNEIFRGELKNYYESLVWKLILGLRKVPELCDDEFNYFLELIYNVYEDNWTAEKIYDYFIDIDNIIKDFHIGE